MSYTTVAHCGTDHQEWIRRVEFYEDDLNALEERLLEIVKKNNGHEAMAGVEHFQNQFILQKDSINDLKYIIRQHDHKVASDAQKHAGKMGQYLTEEHEVISEKVESFEKVNNELRREFTSFLSKWM